jgi:hypothetical protein
MSSCNARSNEIAALDPLTRREVAWALRRVAEMFAEVRDGKSASYVLAYSPACSTQLDRGAAVRKRLARIWRFPVWRLWDCDTGRDAAPRGARRGNSKFAAP